ncbi:GntR family transcriptional regulator [Photobacterium kishitanii]|uniref:GntR family transcriptional regulator n=1 Tax=Photobacterium kishitanii TaxID=318456 RepID=UPI000D175C21|nr:GntR family transcriptional regulator [Photobacterium kishitanii]PSU86691.1 GntR family transcriptional regulator [Photobacterium kishitanii]
MEQHFIKHIKNKIDVNASTPLYLQLKNILEELIKNKTFKHGSVLPSERKLSEILGLSRVTIVKALAELTELNLVIKKHGKGTVINLPIDYNLSGGGFSSQLKQQGVVSNRWLIRELIANKHPQKLEINCDQRIAKLKRVRLVDGMPVSIETTYIPEQFLPRPDLLEESLYGYWEQQGIDIDVQEYTLAIYRPTIEEATMLEVSPNFPLMKIKLKTYNKSGDVIECGSIICNTDYYHFKFNVKVAL